MQLTVVLLAALCLAVPVLSNAPCKPSVTEAPNYNTNAPAYQYRYVLATRNPTNEQLSSAELTTTRIGSSTYGIFVRNYYNGSQSSVTYELGPSKGASINETLIIDGQESNVHYTITIFAFQPLKYSQFLVCGPSEYQSDLRFAILYGDTKLTASLKKELLANDARFNFNGELIQIGSKNKKQSPSDDLADVSE